MDNDNLKVTVDTLGQVFNSQHNFTSVQKSSLRANKYHIHVFPVNLISNTPISINSN